MYLEVAMDLLVAVHVADGGEDRQEQLHDCVELEVLLK